MKVKIINTDYKHKGKIYPEGSELDVTNKELEAHSDFLILIKDQASSNKKPVVSGVEPSRKKKEKSDKK